MWRGVDVVADGGIPLFVALFNRFCVAVCLSSKSVAASLHSPNLPPVYRSYLTDPV